MNSSLTFMAKLKLDITDLEEEFFEDTRLLGIVSPLKDYQFCWHVNNIIQFDFRINTDIEIILKKKQREYYFSVFQFSEPAGSLVHYLYNNHYDGEFLLPELRHLDYLWLMKGDVVEDSKMNYLIQSIKSISQVQMVTELASGNIKSKTNLVF